MERTTLDKILRIGIKAALVIISIAGIIVSATAEGFMSTDAFKYFTIQSNITILLICAVFLVDEIRQLRGKPSFVTNWLLIVKFVFTVAITVTFLVFFALLAPSMGIGYLLSFGNLSVHFLVPALALLDFFLYDHRLKMNRWQTLFALIMPAYYFAFAIIGSTIDGFFTGFVPYFFLNYRKFTWFGFTDSGFGVFYWFILLASSIAGLAYLLRWLLGKRGISATAEEADFFE
jgi:hypothetical protein